MEIKDYLVNTLNDWAGKIPIEIFLGGCNFRCGFCHNPHLVENYNDKPTLIEEEILNYLKRDKRKGWKDGVIISGGEPTIHKDLPELIEKIKTIGFPVKLDTNGSNPEMLKELIENNLLDSIAMDFKTILPDYKRVVNVEVDSRKIDTSSKLIMASSLDYMFRTTVVPGLHDKNTIKLISCQLEGAKCYQIQNFHYPEKGRTLDTSFKNINSFPIKELDEFKKIAEPHFDKVIVRE